jgi:ESCRT-II complex subunit VPS22
MASRRGVGLSAFSNEAIKDAYTNYGTSIQAQHLDSLQTQLSVFQQLLHNFSITHAKDIRSNPTFRAEFARMCNAIGVDPLASSHTSKDAKGGGSIWSQMLGGSVNDFYFELAVRVVEICRETRAENGGMLAVADVKKRVQQGRGIGGGMEVSEYVVFRSHDYVYMLTKPAATTSAVLSRPWNLSLLASRSSILELLK